MIECEICFEEYPEGHLELHRPTCLVRLMFRCSICNADYVSREGLWTHLDLHKITDNSKELHYQELKAKHKIYQCVLCNDQCGYSESSYGTHVRNFHENRDQSVLATESVLVKAEHMIYDEESLEQSQDAEQSSRASETYGNRSVDQADANLYPDVKQIIRTEDSEFIITNLTESKNSQTRFACDSCAKIFLSEEILLHHKETFHKGAKYTCPTCGKSFCCRKDNLNHYLMCREKMWLCYLCGRTFTWLETITRHNKQKHPETGSSETIQLIPAQDVTEYLKRERIPVAPVDRKHATVNKLDSQLYSTSSAIGNNNDSNLNNDSKKLVDSSKPSKPYPCPICGITLENRGQIFYHRLTKHTEAKYECPSCSRKFHIRNRFEIHVACCQNQKRMCEMCGQKFHHKSKLQLHIKNVHHVSGNGNDESADSAQDMITCDICAIAFNSAHGLAKHKLTCLGNTKEYNDTIKLEIEVEETMLKEQENPMSKECSGRLPTKPLHTRRPKIPRLPRKEYESPVRNEAGDLVWPCSICQLTFEKKRGQQYHVTVYHTDPLFKCCFCRKKMHNAVDTRRHEKVCSKKRCHECSILFASHILLQAHIVEKHSQDEKSENKKAAGAETLEKGIENKDGKGALIASESPDKSRVGRRSRIITYPCSTCGRVYASKQYLDYHKVTSHTEPQLKCSFCPRMFHLIHKLRNHMKFCSEMRCNKCSLKFTSRAKRNDHFVEKHSNDDDSMNVETENLKVENDVEDDHPEEDEHILGK